MTNLTLSERRDLNQACLDELPIDEDSALSRAFYRGRVSLLDKLIREEENARRTEHDQ